MPWCPEDVGRKEVVWEGLACTGSCVGLSLMFSNKVWGLDYSPRNLLAMCCGFFASSGRGDSGGRFDDGGQDGGKAGEKAESRPDGGEGEKVKAADSVSYGTTDGAANGQ